MPNKLSPGATVIVGQSVRGVQSPNDVGVGCKVVVESASTVPKSLPPSPPSEGNTVGCVVRPVVWGAPRLQPSAATIKSMRTSKPRIIKFSHLANLYPALASVCASPINSALLP